MMATELVPSSIPANDRLQSTEMNITVPDSRIIGFDSQLVHSGVGVNPWEDDHGFSLVGSPYMRPQGILPSPLVMPQTGINSRHNSIDLLSLPDPVIQSQPNDSASFFSPSNGLNEDIMQNLPLPTISMDSMKRPYSPVTDLSPMEEDPELAKKRRRMEKNRQTAKTCRQRKKERKEAIQEEVVLFPPTHFPDFETP